jgi:hypothetical protein
LEDVPASPGRPFKLACEPADVDARLRRILLVVRVDVALMFLIVFDMVAKPFSY